MLAAEAAFEALQALPEPDEAVDAAEEDEEEMPLPFTGPVADLSAYQARFDESWVYEELKSVRNMRPAAHGPLGMWGSFIYAYTPSLEQMLMT